MEIPPGVAGSGGLSGGQGRSFLGVGVRQDIPPGTTECFLGVLAQENVRTVSPE